MMQSQIVHLPQKGVLFMYIKTVTFEVLAEAKETFSEKIRKDIASMKTFEGCLQSECWINEKKASVDFQLVSKWQEKETFPSMAKAARTLAKHREAYRAEKEGNGKPSVVINKSGQDYSLFDDSLVSFSKN